MFAWIAENIATILICFILLLIATAIIIHLIKDKKRGASSCGNHCAHCAMAGSCHKK